MKGCLCGVIVNITICLIASANGDAKTTIQNKGSDTLVNVAQAWAEAYAAINPDVIVAVSGGGTGTGIAALINGTVDIANARNVTLEARNVAMQYGGRRILREVTLSVDQHEIFGIIGPANSGKTSFVKSLNRMDAFDANMRVSGEILFQGRNIREMRNVYALRSRIGVVFPLPVGLPLTVYDNVALSPRLRGIRKKADLNQIVERCLQRAALWDEVKDRLNSR